MVRKHTQQRQQYDCTTKYCRSDQQLITEFPFNIKLISANFWSIVNSVLAVTLSHNDEKYFWTWVLSKKRLPLLRLVYHIGWESQLENNLQKIDGSSNANQNQ
jgi:hypothetical protein